MVQPDDDPVLLATHYFEVLESVSLRSPPRPGVFLEGALQYMALFVKQNVAYHGAHTVPPRGPGEPLGDYVVRCANHYNHLNGGGSDDRADF